MRTLVLVAIGMLLAYGALRLAPAARRRLAAGGFALAWLLAQGTDIVPIPGARSLAHLEENVAAAQIKLSGTELAAIGAAIAPASVQGARYPDVELAMVGL